MARLEDITKDATVSGIVANCAVKIVDAKPIGSNALKVVYETPDGTTDQEILYRDREPTLELMETGRPWSFTGDGGIFRLVSEALRIQLAYLLDPVLAVRGLPTSTLPVVTVTSPNCFETVPASPRQGSSPDTRTYG